MYLNRKTTGVMYANSQKSGKPNNSKVFGSK